MLEYYEIMKRVLDVKTNETICVIETFPLITENIPSDKSIFMNWENAEEQIQEENLPMRIQGKKGKRILQIFAPKIAVHRSGHLDFQLILRERNCFCRSNQSVKGNRSGILTK